MATYLFTEEELAQRVSARVLEQVFDDDRDGVADAGNIERLQRDATSFVLGYLRGIYDIDVVLDVRPNEVVRLALDYAEAQLARRHPDYVRVDWERLLAAARAEMLDLRNGKTRLDVMGPPEPAANNGATYRPSQLGGDGEGITFFQKGLGDF